VSLEARTATCLVAQRPMLGVSDPPDSAVHCGRCSWRGASYSAGDHRLRLMVNGDAHRFITGLTDSPVPRAEGGRGSEVGLGGAGMTPQHQSRRVAPLRLRR